MILIVQQCHVYLTSREMFTCYWDIICLYSQREQPHNITLKHECYSLDQGTTNDMPNHIEPLDQAAECEPMSSDQSSR